MSRPVATCRGFGLVWLIAGCLLTTATAQAQRLAPLPQDLSGFENFTIADIQGTETFSPLTGERIATTGVVTLWLHDRTGFWIQDPKGDGDPVTSEGLFVVLGKEPQVAARPAVGDRVRVIGIVEEEHRSSFLPLTRLNEIVSLEILESGVPLPPPVALVDLPNTELHDAVVFWEPLEGMRVSLANGTIVSATLSNGLFVALAPADAVAGSGFHPETSILIMGGLEDGRVDWNPERIVIDVAALAAPVEVIPGDKVVSMVGVVDFRGQDYLVQAEKLDVDRRPRPQIPVSTRDGLPGDVKIVDYNLRDFFDEVDNPERFDENYNPIGRKLGYPSAQEVANRIAKHTLAIIHELQLPHVIVSQEFESQELFQRVGDKVNAAAGTRYRAVSKETSDVRGLEVGFLYDEARVSLVEVFQMAGPEVEKAFGLISPFRTREPLVGVFRFSPDTPPVTIIACKFKTKRLDPPALSLNARHVRVTEKQRQLQARVVRDYVTSVLAKDPRALVMVAGDLGDVEYPEPGEGEHVIGILRGRAGEIPMTYLPEREKPADAYGWLYRGNGQKLSHVLVSPALAERCVGHDFLHFNAPFSDLGDVRFDPSTPLRASDRDPFEARFDLGIGKQ